MKNYFKRETGKMSRRLVLFAGAPNTGSEKIIDDKNID